MCRLLLQRQAEDNKDVADSALSAWVACKLRFTDSFLIPGGLPREEMIAAFLIPAEGGESRLDLPMPAPLLITPAVDCLGDERA